MLSPEMNREDESLIFQLENVTKIFRASRRMLQREKREVTALRSVSFSIKRDEIFGLVGESGSGKTTCGRLMVKLDEPSSGSLFLKGIDITAINGSRLKEFRKNIQMIFQDPYQSLNPRMNIYDSVREPLVVQKIGDIFYREERIRYVMELIGLKPAEDFFFRYPHELSGGQRQRVAIARAMTVEPEFIVADEPTSMLDASIRAHILNLLLEIREKLNVSFLIITHDLAMARYICDRIAVIYHGSIVEVGPSESIIARPHHPYTKALIAAVPLPDPHHKRMPPVKGDLPLLVAGEHRGCPYRSRCVSCQNRCEEGDKPVMFDVEEDHCVACHLYEGHAL
jgi:peptide/nickel transport system ATP-binding protein